TGWVGLTAGEARWSRRPARGDSLPLTGVDEYEAETYFPMHGMSIQVLPPGEPNATYHWETEQEDFFVLAGEALLIVEGQERPLRQWDFVHCPPETRHVFVGAGDGPCVILAASSRQFQKDGPWGFYCADETAGRYNASSPEDTQDGNIAYARSEPPRPGAVRSRVPPAEPIASASAPPSKARLGAIMLSIRVPGTSRPRSRSVSPSMLFRWRSKPGKKSPEPRPRLVVRTHALPFASQTARFVVWPPPRASAKSASTSASTRSRSGSPRSRGNCPNASRTPARPSR